MIGPISAKDRLERVLAFFHKRRRIQIKHIYRCRAKVADNRLRIKGRFVTKE
jgi:hypothetical protein